ncbi:MAG: hypothetical protein OXI24_05655 [Candidatus Poribacteria bacterium]|nr:hypothetical protein [Candidatus Poribacteria bacterium]
MNPTDKVIATGGAIGGSGIIAGITLGHIQTGISILSGVVILITVVLYYISLFKKVNRENEILERKDREGSELTNARLAAAEKALQAKQAELDFWTTHGHAPDNNSENNDP